jgi:hypothetical protein
VLKIQSKYAKKGIQTKGMGRVHFFDEYKRPLIISGEIFVGLDNSEAYVKVEGTTITRSTETTKLTETTNLLIPFKNIAFIEWTKIEG